MKPPVKLDDLREEWYSKDCIIDETEPGKELIRISSLHGKYLNILSYHRMLSKKYMKEYDHLKLIKTHYYLGELSYEDLQERGWEPEQRTIGKPSLPLYLDADSDLTNLLIKKMVQDEIVDFCTMIIRELNNRVFAIRAFIDWKKMTS